MAEDLEKLLDRFKRDIVAHVDESSSGVQQSIEQATTRTESQFREVFSLLDGLFARFTKLDDELQALSAAVSRLESRSLSRAEFEREIEKLRERISHLQHHLDEVEKMHREN